ncbi:DNA phosphorothioation-dependent restriction protein DptF [Bacteroides mediterraneensis]|uniref:DNA phosphorothioation-dependent restriction protein DptF n=1 Tax=Bacteroides mediterraneensis TaxID=1841856 RepID=A0ABS2EUY7_9BACE|nr:DNA phosphorothioation-dependent restriction protein DptF [Bacteroides mediterraneensis]MBM6758183.1 DNA phosphorothioation-dependent restriction protein DptF [Bacteroides mediterraneensis]
MLALHLKEAFFHLSQNSIDSVQCGKRFSEWDEYMHVDRPIEDKLIDKMNEIDDVGGGIILLVGSAGDGKSHLISRIRQISDWKDESFYNDATASSSPKKTAIDTLKEALVEYKDSNLYLTNKKLVLAINLGKLNALIEDIEFKAEYKEIVNVAWSIFNDDATPSSSTSRVKIIPFSKEQIFEFDLSSTEALPVNSNFLHSIMGKIVARTENNPFYKAYKEDLAEDVSPKDPLILNYQLLSMPEVRNTIVMTVIEAIICYRLIITPREFLDFLYSIMVYPQYDSYKEKVNFYEALLPSLLYTGNENVIQKAICKLDPLKHSSTDHDSQLSVLFTSYSIPVSYFNVSHIKELPIEMLNRINDFYANNGRDIERTTKFVFRLKHLLCYHSESKVYLSFIDLLKGIFKQDIHKMQDIYDLVSKTIPRHYSSYYEKSNMIPLNIQGGRYRLFANLLLKPQKITPYYSPFEKNNFLIKFNMSWKFANGNILLCMDYQLYSYLYELNRGKLSLSYENEKNLIFNTFVKQLIEKCDCEQDITVVRSDTKELRLSESAFGNIELQ